MELYEKATKFVLGATVIILIILWIIPYFQKFESSSLSYEYLKLTYQFALLTVIGAAVTLLFVEYARTNQKKEADKVQAQEKKDARKEIYRKFFTQYETAYNSAKRIRRELRSGSRSNQPSSTDSSITLTSENAMIEKDPYDEQMKELIDVQLKFEYLEKLAGTDFFAGIANQDKLVSYLDSIEKYLNEIVSEYESSYMKFSRKTSISITELPKLAEFIGPYDFACNFREKFKYPDKKIQSILVDLMLEK